MSIFHPDISVGKVFEITKETLDALGVTALILDVDNTLTTHNNPRPEVSVLAWLAKMREAGIRMIILSNNSRERVLPFAKELRLGFVARGAKPLRWGYRKAAAVMGVEKARVAVVGDQIFTDILGGNLAGMKTILVEPLHPEKGPFFRLKRRAEKSIRRRIRDKG